MSDSMISVDCYQKNKYVITFTTDDMISKFEAFENHKLVILYLTKRMKNSGFKC